MSGAAGAWDAGLYEAGEDGPAATPTRRARTVPIALQFLQPGADFELGADGLFASTHPTHQKVRLALLTKLGASPAAPTIGFDWTTPFATGERLPADVTDRIRDALSRSAVTGIEEVRITASSPIPGRVRWMFVYRLPGDSQEVTLNG